MFCDFFLVITTITYVCKICVFVYYLNLQVYFGSSCIIVSIYLYDEQKYLSGEVDKPTGESFLEKEEISPSKL